VAAVEVLGLVLAVADVSRPYANRRGSAGGQRVYFWATGLGPQAARVLRRTRAREASGAPGGAPPEPPRRPSGGGPRCRQRPAVPSGGAARQPPTEESVFAVTVRSQVLVAHDEHLPGCFGRTELVTADLARAADLARRKATGVGVGMGDGAHGGRPAARRVPP